MFWRVKKFHGIQHRNTEMDAHKNHFEGNKCLRKFIVRSKNESLIISSHRSRTKWSRHASRTSQTTGVRPSGPSRQARWPRSSMTAFVSTRSTSAASTRPRKSLRRCPTSARLSSQRCTSSGSLTLSPSGWRTSSPSLTCSMSTLPCPSPRSKVGVFYVYRIVNKIGFKIELKWLWIENFC